MAVAVGVGVAVAVGVAVGVGVGLGLGVAVGVGVGVGLAACTLAADTKKSKKAEAIMLPALRRYEFGLVFTVLGRLVQS